MNSQSSGRPVPADIDDLARIVVGCCTDTATLQEVRESLHSAHETIKILNLRLRWLEEKQEADRAAHAARLRTLERR